MMRQRSPSPHSTVADDDQCSLSPLLPPTPAPGCIMTKRQHALQELLSSERAYASDLSLIREYHIPLALGQAPPPTNLPVLLSNEGPPPMSPEDVKIIFGNVAELAVLSDLFSKELELALGPVVGGGQGEDRVGELLLRIIPKLEQPFKHYITRHPTALSHLQNLPQTPALSAYLAYTQTVASSLSHAWDIASLLIKPVQRLLRYPLLLEAIIDETLDSHPDKENLRLARVRMEQVGRSINEGRRRAEVVKDVLSGTKGSKKGPGVGVVVGAGMSLSKRNLKHGSIAAASMKAMSADEDSACGGPALGNRHEAAKVESLQAELKTVDVFAQQFAKNVVNYSKMMSNLMLALRHWVLSFGRVIGLSAEHGSEAFDAFLEVVERQLMPLAVDLQGTINKRILKETAFLLNTMTQPLKLLASMNEQEPFHYHLLTVPMSAKHRPPQSLLAASNNYLALRGQLAAELPDYLRLLNKGFTVVVRQFVDIQTRFWKDVQDRWSELWDMLRVEGERNAGWEETVRVWSMRWQDVDEVVSTLGVTEPLPPAVNDEDTSLDDIELTFLPNPAFYVYGFSPVSSGHERQEKSERDTRKRSSSLKPISSRSSNSPNSISSKSSPTSTLTPSKPREKLGRVVRSQSYPLKPRNSPTSDPEPQEKLERDTRNRSSSAKPRNSLASTFLSSISDESYPTSTLTPLQPPEKQEKSVRCQSSFVKPRNSFTSGFSNLRLPEPIPTSPLSLPPSNPQPQEVSEHGVLRRSNSLDSIKSETSLFASNSSNPSSNEWPPTPMSSPPRLISNHKRQLERDVCKRSSSNEYRPTSISMFPPPPWDPHIQDSVRPRNSLASNFSDSSSNESPPTSITDFFLPTLQRDSWESKPAEYVCQVVHPCEPPVDISYCSFPFFALLEGDLYDVLQEAGHPSIHPKLPLCVDNREDCLLLCRDESGVVGWALASFLEPVGLDFWP